ncbi:MAG TPA: VOC family protein [Caulobacteraceae bacterium]|nr:VOC family protein [Caulobacteraceae bacterium]
MAIHIRDIDHVVLRVRDPEAMRAFYCEVLGCTVAKVQERIGLVQLQAGRSMIDLVDVNGVLGKMGGAAPGKEARNMDHFCLRVEPFDGEAILSFLKDHGIDGGEVVPRFGAEGDGPSIYITDPEGNAVELKGPPYSTGLAR